jgi:RNA polymerase sigma-70 factor (ECF subfamily)
LLLLNTSCQIVAPVFSDYRDSLMRYISSRVKDSVESEELLSQVLLKTYDHCEKLDEIRNIEAWLITIARNTIVDAFREKQGQLSVVPEQIDETHTDIYRELEACVPSLINRLPPKYAWPLKAYELDGITQKDLAKQYQMSESGMRSRIQRGRKLLRQLFQDYCGHLVAETGCSGTSKC